MKNRGIRALLIAAGVISMFMGLVGAFVPLLPTTPFLLISAACFARSSGRLYRFLHENPLFGKYLRRYRDGQGMARSHKIGVITLLWFTLAFSGWLVGREQPLALLALAAVGVGVTAHLARL
jgi:uncharacterized membrane protein YbaN (DUF454 family)